MRIDVSERTDFHTQTLFTIFGDEVGTMVTPAKTSSLFTVDIMRERIMRRIRFESYC